MILIPAVSPDDWRRLLADPDKHWKAGYSAHALAHRWQAETSFPPEIQALLDQAPRLRDCELVFGIPEHKVSLPGGARASQTDLWALGRTQTELVSIAVEGKVRESFGPTLDEWMRTDSDGRNKRWAYLCEILQLAPECDRATRYQLVHRTASALIEARRLFLHAAVLLVHSFSAELDSFGDFEKFAALIKAKIDRPGQLASAGDRSGVELFVGWAQGPPAAKESDA